MPKGKVDDPIKDQEIAFALLVLAGKLTDREAAEAVGISPGQAAYVKAKPRVKAYMDSHRASVAAAIVEHESAALVELNINRETIMARYWELSQLPSTQTNGNISGQVRALDSLRDMLGLMGLSKDKPEGEITPEPSVYRAKWMDKRDKEADDGASSKSGEGVAPTLRRTKPTPAPSRIERPPAAPMKLPPPPAEREPWVPNAGFGRFQGM